MKKVALFLLAVVMVAGVAGCGGGGGDDDNDGPMDVSGTWTGTGTSTATGTEPTAFNLSQSGASVSGTWDDYPVSGSIDGNSLHLTLTPFTKDGVTFTGNIEGVVEGDSMSGTLQIKGTKGSAVIIINGTFTVTRTGKSVGRGAADGVLGTIVRAMAN